jgi:predicted nucleic acid-binding protein
MRENLLATIGSIATKNTIDHSPGDGKVLHRHQHTPAMIRRAVEIRKTYRINFWDACIVSNAEYAECDTIYSEDLNTGQFYSGIRIENPFSE